MKEKELKQLFIKYLIKNGYSYTRNNVNFNFNQDDKKEHFYSSASGVPDLTVFKNNLACFVELKVGNNTLSNSYDYFTKKGLVKHFIGQVERIKKNWKNIKTLIVTPENYMAFGFALSDIYYLNCEEYLEKTKYWYKDYLSLKTLYIKPTENEERMLRGLCSIKNCNRKTLVSAVYINGKWKRSNNIMPILCKQHEIEWLQAQTCN